MPPVESLLTFGLTCWPHIVLIALFLAMIYTVYSVIVCAGFMQLIASQESETIRGSPCVRRNKQVYCPFTGSKLANLYKASGTNSSLSLGPTMYYRRFTVSTEVRSSTSTTEPPTYSSKSNTHVMYYTKQYDQSTGQNAFNLDDESEHEFMHHSDVEENVIDHDNLIRKVKRANVHVFIDENKALIRRMFGHYHSDADWLYPDSRDHFSSFHEGPDRKKLRVKRSIGPSPLLSNKVDSCQSSVEIVTPYWASNSAGKIRAIVNTQHLQQAIQQEVCQAVQTKYCNKGCTCEQKYKWHRLLAYDPDDDCKGIFMDWFLFPSCCVCRCAKY